MSCPESGFGQILRNASPTVPLPARERHGPAIRAAAGEAERRRGAGSPQWLLLLTRLLQAFLVAWAWPATCISPARRAPLGGVGWRLWALRAPFPRSEALLATPTPTAGLPGVKRNTDGLWHGSAVAPQRRCCAGSGHVVLAQGAAHGAFLPRVGRCGSASSILTASATATCITLCQALCWCAALCNKLASALLQL